MTNMGESTFKGLWWYVDQESLPTTLAAVWRNLETAQSAKIIRWKKWLGLYEGRQITGLDLAKYADYLPSDVINCNYIESVIDSLLAKIATGTPRAWVLTDEGSWDLMERAEAMTALVAGVYQEQSAYQTSRETFLGACIFGDGFTQIFPDSKNGRIEVENVFRPELRFDDLDGRYRRPRASYRHKIMSRPVLEELYGVEIPSKGRENADLLVSADSSAKDIMRQIEDPVSVIEAYHLPSGPGAKDGRRVITTPSACVVDESWDWPHFPYARFSLKPRAIGMDSKGAAEQLAGHQNEVTEVAKKLQRLMQAATTRVAMERGSEISQEEATNDPYAALHYTGTPPVVLPDVPFHPSWLEYFRMLKAEMYELFGMSLLYAQGKKPPGLDAAAAIREVKDSESERFQDISQAWDEYHVSQNGAFPSLSRLIIWAAGVVDEHADEGFSATLIGENDSLRKVAWKDCYMDAGNYRLALWPSSLLPKQPAGRLQTVKELVGMFPQLQPMLGSLLKFPDLGPAMSVIADPTKGILQDLKSLNKGERVAVEPWIDKALAKALVTGSYLSARGRQAPRRVLEAHRDYLLALKTTQEQEAKEEAARAAGGPMGPALPPMGPPGAPGPLPGPMGPAPLQPPIQGEIPMAPALGLGGPLP